ncbi:MAG TPA: hypothetical protein VE175_08470 [Woeseiaceae bacterium]|nr:hypothetical protein [Woeseiaceae bacterium]
MSAPIVLIHYGNSSYLPYVIEIAKRFNPHKEIIFLGDEENAYLESFGVSHYRFATSCGSPELELFDRLYPRIVNPSYPKSRWAQFVLQRWFMINTFIHKYNIDQFWTFDSDNFILTDLQFYEEEFARYDCTSQCSGRCMNGFVSSQGIVQRYIEKIIELLSDDNHVKHWHGLYKSDPSLFYNEMEAFAVFVEQEAVRNLPLAQIRDGRTFDDSITYENGMLMYEKTIKGRRVKKLYINDGEMYCKHLESDRLVKMDNLNLSWMPKYIFPLLFEYIVGMRVQTAFSELDLLNAPWSYHLKLFIRNRIPKPIRDQISGGTYWV